MVLGLLLSWILPLLEWLLDLLKVLLILFFLISFIAGAISFFKSGFQVPRPSQSDQVEESSTVVPLPEPVLDTFQLDTAGIQLDTVRPKTDSLMVHYRTWRGYKREQYSGYLKVRVSDMRASSINKNAMPHPTDPDSIWTYIYQSLYAFDKGRLEEVYATFDSIRTKYNLNRLDFAEMMVTCIQDINYTIILQKSCNPWEYSDPFTREFLSNGGPCAGNARFGVLSPTEFVGTLAGDCDTRSLLLYTLLDHFGYQVALFSSDVYRHAIIGVELPYLGTSITHNNVRYVLWETTAVVPPGTISASYANLNHWSPAIISTKIN
jgi:hypothetical protein